MAYWPQLPLRYVARREMSVAEYTAPDSTMTTMTGDRFRVLAKEFILR